MGTTQKCKSHIKALFCHPIYSGISMILLIVLGGCKSQSWDKLNFPVETESQYQESKEPKGRMVWRSTLVWWITVSTGEKEVLKILKPHSLEFSTDADLSIHLAQDTLKEIKISNGQDMPIVETIREINSNSITLSLGEYFCSERFKGKLDQLYVIFYTKVGHTQSLRIDIKNNDRKLICD